MTAFQGAESQRQSSRRDAGVTKSDGNNIRKNADGKGATRALRYLV
jgi:hypothetical protein